MSNLAKITPVFSINSFMGFFFWILWMQSSYEQHFLKYVFDQFNEYLLNESVVISF